MIDVEKDVGRQLLDRLHLVKVHKFADKPRCKRRANHPKGWEWPSGTCRLLSVCRVRFGADGWKHETNKGNFTVYILQENFTAYRDGERVKEMKKGDGSRTEGKRKGKEE